MQRPLTERVQVPGEVLCALGPDGHVMRPQVAEELECGTCQLEYGFWSRLNSKLFSTLAPTSIPFVRLPYCLLPARTGPSLSPALVCRAVRAWLGLFMILGRLLYLPQIFGLSGDPRSDGGFHEDTSLTHISQPTDLCFWSMEVYEGGPHTWLRSREGGHSPSDTELGGGST